jgi:hypothetical protein
VSFPNGNLVIAAPWQPAQTQTPPSDQPPARVQVAMELLGMLSAKTMTRAAIGEGVGNIITIEGQKLSPDESNARAEACSMLMDYFKGKLKPSPFEQPRLKDARTLTFIRCPVCHGDVDGRTRCGMCNGEGKIEARPLS